jgi:hypothetical protein
MGQIWDRALTEKVLSILIHINIYIHLHVFILSYWMFIFDRGI